MAAADDDRQRLLRRARQRAQLQLQAFGQIARADAGRLHRLQPLERHLEAVQQLLALLRVGLLAQDRGDQLLERILEVAVLVQRFDQRQQRRAVHRAQVHAGDLRPQHVLQRFRRRLRLGPLVVVARGRGRAARRLADAVKVVALGAVLPVVALGGAEFLGAHLLPRGRVAGRRLGLGLRDAFLAFLALGQTLLRGGGQRGVEFLVGLQQRIAGEHLLHLLVELQRRQLQQTDGLLQLRRQREMLGQANL